MIKGGAKQKNRPGGDPHINLCLSVLGKAKEHHWDAMWQSFLVAVPRVKNHHDPLQIAQWVSWWWGTFIFSDTLRKCPNCQITTFAEIQQCDICQAELIFEEDIEKGGDYAN